MPTIGNATLNELKTTTGGKPGNQRGLKKLETGVEDFTMQNELCLQPWKNLNSPEYSPQRPLVAVFRFNKEEYRRAIAQAMINACNNPYVGYDSDNERETYRK